MADKSSKADLQNPDYSPPLSQAIPLGIQHVLAMFAGNVTVPIIIGGMAGLAGGGDGATGKNWVEHAPAAGAAAGKVTALGHRGSVELESGDVFVIQTPGGGAYGAAD